MLWVLIILGILMIYLGSMFGLKVMYPPIVTGMGFFIIAWGFQSLK